MSQVTLPKLIKSFRSFNDTDDFAKSNETLKEKYNIKSTIFGRKKPEKIEEKREEKNEEKRGETLNYLEKNTKNINDSFNSNLFKNFSSEYTGSKNPSLTNNESSFFLDSHSIFPKSQKLKSFFSLYKEKFDSSGEINIDKICFEDDDDYAEDKNIKNKNEFEIIFDNDLINSKDIKGNLLKSKRNCDNCCTKEICLIF